MRYLLPAILLLGTQIASAQSILKDKDDKELSVLLPRIYTGFPCIGLCDSPITNSVAKIEVYFILSSINL